MPDDLGSDVNMRDNDGKTPLHIAKDKNASNIVRLLLNHGAADVTPEVVSAHQRLQNQCEIFEAFVDKLCASSLQSLRAYKFYECVLTAADCVDALTQFQAASTNEDKAYEAEVAKADEMLNQQKREYKAEVAKADEMLNQQKNSLKNNAVRKIAEIQQKVSRYEYKAGEVNVTLGVVNVNAEEFIKNRATVERSHSEIPFNQALDSVSADVPEFANYVKGIAILAIPSMVVGGLLFDSLAAGICILIIISALIYFIKRGNITNNLRQLNSAAIAELSLIGQEMQSAVAKASVERDKQVADASLRRDEAIPERDKQVADAGLRRDEAMAYIEQEYQSFDERLCLCMDKFQTLLEDWSKENANVVSLLDENRVQTLDENIDQISPRLTRVGTFGFLSRKFSQASSDFAESESPPVLNDPSGAEGNNDLSPDTVEQEDAEVLFVRGLNEQGVLMKPDNSADLDLYLKELFSGWVISGDLDTSTLSAFDSILRITGYEDPRQTMQAWVEFAKKQVSDVLELPTSKLEYLDINLSIELDQLDVETSFFLLYELSTKQGDPAKIARVRLALIALVGEKKQQQLVGEFNERIAPKENDISPNAVE